MWSDRGGQAAIGMGIMSALEGPEIWKGAFPSDAIKQAVVRVFSVLLLLASVWFWLDGSLPLAYGLILVIASFMVFNDLENAGRPLCCKCWRPRWIRQSSLMTRR